jgi:hypothetical protein
MDNTGKRYFRVHSWIAKIFIELEFVDNIKKWYFGIRPGVMCKKFIVLDKYLSKGIKAIFWYNNLCLNKTNRAAKKWCKNRERE